MNRKIAFNNYGFASFLTAIFLCILGLGGGCLFLVEDASALYVPSISVSTNALNSVNGNAVLNSTNKTTEIPINLTVQTNHRTGYTATMSAETSETALVNASSANNAKINSITSPLGLANFPTNSWGYKLSTETTYSPIPGVGNPANLINTSGKTDGLDSRVINVGMNLSQNLESGRYVNKLVFSVVTNPYEKEAVLTAGPDFIQKVTALDTNQTYDVWNENMGKKENVRAFRRSHVAPAAVPANAVNVEDNASSDYEIKVWFDAAEGVMYYWAPIEKIYLNQNASRMFMHFTKLTELDLSSFNTDRVTNMSEMFRGVKELTSLNLSSFNTQNVTNMSGMFYEMSKVTNLNLSSFNTQNVTDMSRMFQYVGSISSLDLSHFDTKNVINMNEMFSSMKNLTTLDVSSFNTSKVIDMSLMFWYSSKINVINLSHFDTSNVTNMRMMFYHLSNLEVLNISNFNTEKVTDMSDMFYDMQNLVTLDISNFNTKNVTNFFHMFSLDYDSRGSDKLEKIYVNNDFDTSSLMNASDIFAYRYKLRGGNGSYLAYPSSADKTWLRVDRPGVQGYFTRKS